MDGALTYAGAVDSDLGPRRLVLLRHAKAERLDGVDDPDRPLAERGIVDATATGPALAGLVELTPADVVLCSPAVRTRQTWRLVARAQPTPPPTRFNPVIYGASLDELLALIRSVPSATGTVLVIGHEPTMSQTATTLAGPGSSAPDLARLTSTYPTSGLALFTVPPVWSALAPGTAVLQHFSATRG